MPNTSTSQVKGQATARSQDAIALLKQDHREVSEMFEEYESNKEKMRAPGKKRIAEQICNALTIHARIEEEIFYPACDEAVEDAEDLLAEARVEHDSLKTLIGKIKAAEPGSEQYDAEVKVLGEYVKHHVKEEQNELFPKVRKSDLDLADLGARLAARKAELGG